MEVLVTFYLELLWVGAFLSFSQSIIGMLLDGSASAKKKAINMLNWDVNNGVARRAWAGNDNAKFAIGREMKQNPKLKVTPRNETREEVLGR